MLILIALTDNTELKHCLPATPCEMGSRELPSAVGAQQLRKVQRKCHSTVIHTDVHC